MFVTGDDPLSFVPLFDVAPARTAQLEILDATGPEHNRVFTRSRDTFPWSVVAVNSRAVHSGTATSPRKPGDSWALSQSITVDEWLGEKDGGYLAAVIALPAVSRAPEAVELPVVAIGAQMGLGNSAKAGLT